MKELILPEKERLFYNETAKEKVLDFLFRFPEKEFSLTELAKKAKVAKANIGNILKEFEKIDFIKIERFNNLWRIRTNQTSEKFRASKFVYNLNYIVNSGLIDFLEEHYLYPSAIILFGSFRKGEDISVSDIDIAIETSKTQNYKVEELRELKEFEKLFGKKIQLHLFNEKVESHLLNNILNGIVLSGFLDVEKWKKK